MVKLTMLHELILDVVHEANGAPLNAEQILERMPKVDKKKSAHVRLDTVRLAIEDMRELGLLVDANSPSYRAKS